MRALPVVLVSALSLAALVACGDDGAALGDVEGVASVQEHEVSSEPGETFLRITLDDGLADDDVRDVVDEVEDVLVEDDDTPDAVQVVVDDLYAEVQPGDTRRGRTELERVLWLRADGRATGYGPADAFRPDPDLGPVISGLVTAPASDVAGLAADLTDWIGGQEEAERRGFVVGSTDGATRVDWEGYPGQLEIGDVGAFAAVQEELPGTTGWLDGDGVDAGVHLDAADLTLDQAVARGPALIGDLPFTSEVGWGPLRANSFPELATLAQQLGPALTRLLALDGIRAVDQRVVQVETIEAVRETRRLVPFHSVQLVREPSDGAGYEPVPLFEVGGLTPPADVDLYEELSQVDGFRAIRAAGLVIESGIADADLERLLALLRPTLAGRETLSVVVAEPPVLGLTGAVLGDLIGNGTFEAVSADERFAPATDDLVERVIDAWADAPTS